MLEAIAAKTDAGPCVTHVGPGGSGHFVKMVHNGIEYADMQLIAETWDVLRRGLGHDARRRRLTCSIEWNAGPLESFLVELTAKVCRTIDPETGQPLVDVVLDKAGQKGTGRWTAQVALDLGVAIPTIAAAIDARVLSSMKEERVAAAAALKGPSPADAVRTVDRAQAIDDLRDALYAARICGYAQGMALIRAGSDRYKWNVNLSEIGRIWKAGCIIRARLLDPVRHAFEVDPALVNLLRDPALGQAVDNAQAGWRRTVSRAAKGGLPLAAHATALAYLRFVPHAEVAAEPDAGAARRVRRAHVRADRSRRRCA